MGKRWGLFEIQRSRRTGCKSKIFARGFVRVLHKSKGTLPREVFERTKKWKMGVQLVRSKLS